MSSSSASHDHLIILRQHFEFSILCSSTSIFLILCSNTSIFLILCSNTSIFSMLCHNTTYSTHDLLVGLSIPITLGHRSKDDAILINLLPLNEEGPYHRPAGSSTNECMTYHLQLNAGLIIDHPHPIISRTNPKKVYFYMTSTSE